MFQRVRLPLADRCGNRDSDWANATSGAEVLWNITRVAVSGPLAIGGRNPRARIQGFHSVPLDITTILAASGS